MGQGWGHKGRKTKEGAWWVELGCEMTLLEHGFKYQNKVPTRGVLDSTLRSYFDSQVRINQARLRYMLSFFKYLKHIQLQF